MICNTYHSVCGRCLYCCKRTAKAFMHLNTTFSDLCLCQNRMVSVLPKLSSPTKRGLIFIVGDKFISKTYALFLNKWSRGCFGRFKHVSTTLWESQIFCHLQIFLSKTHFRPKSDQITSVTQKCILQKKKLKGIKISTFAKSLTNVFKVVFATCWTLLYTVSHSFDRIFTTPLYKKANIVLQNSVFWQKMCFVYILEVIFLSQTHTHYFLKVFKTLLHML